MKFISAKGANKKRTKAMKKIEDAVRERGGVWPSDDVEAMYLYKIDNRYIAGLEGGTALHICSRAEFEECARRLRNEPRPEDAPDWAVAWAQDSDGEWSLFSVKPLMGAEYWVRSLVGRHRLAGKGEVIGDWRDTLRLRPEGEKVENKNDWYKRGKFPPVGTVCERQHGSAWLQTKIVGWDGSKIVFTTPWGGYDSAIKKPSDFRPLQTERERWVKEMCRHLHEEGVVSKTWLQRCYDGGLAKMPEDK